MTRDTRPPATAAYDSQIAAELGLLSVDVDLHNPYANRHYRQILLQRYPLKKNPYLPTFILVSKPESDVQTHGEITSSPTEDTLHCLLEDRICKLPPEEQRLARPDKNNMINQGGDKSK